MRASSRQFRLATEMIDFQKDTFGKDLEQLFTEFCDWLDQNYLMLTGEKAQKSGFPEKIQDAVFKRTGIAVVLNVDTDNLACVMPLWANKHHVLLHKMWHGDFKITDQELWAKENVGKSGTINLKAARVGGIFSTYKHGIWFDIISQHQLYKITPAEITAIFLHELGHAFTTLEFSDRLETTNQVMQNLSQTIKRTGDQDERVYFFETLGEALCRDKTAFKEFIDAKPSFFSGMAFFKKFFEVVQSQQETDKYNETSSEQLADQFSTRFGYGKPLITGLHKVHLFYGVPELSRMTRILINLSQIGMLLTSILSFKLILLGSAAGRYDLIIQPIFFILVTLLTIYGNAEKNIDYTYDNVRTRYMRVRHQYVDLLTQAKLEKSELTAALEAIQTLDGLISQTVEFRSVFQYIANFFSFKSRAILKDVRLQKLVEELAHNTLFIKAAELKTLS